MALLKIKGSSLIETIVASVILAIVFTIASLTLNNVFKTTITSNDTQLRYRIDELTYFYNNKTIDLPYYEETPAWDITFEPTEDIVLVEALHKASNHKIRKEVDKE